MAARTAGLRLQIAKYLACLVHNDIEATRGKLATIGQPKRSRYSRVPIPFTMDPELWIAGMARSEELDCDFTAYVEALVRVDIEKPEAPLTILYRCRR